jgi:MFS transporter, DHA3 family, macrolide efflux protein
VDQHTSAPLATNGASDGEQPWKLRFWSIWVGQALSLVGSALTQFVLIWWITDTTGSVQALSIAGAMALLPQALLGPLGGTLADRLNRRLIIIAADSITALCMLVLITLFATGTVEVWHVFVLMFVRSSMQAFQQPAAAASTAMLVPERMIGRVAGFNQALQGVMVIAAAPLGALALAFLPLQGALAIDVATALLGLVPLFIFAIPQPPRASGPETHLWQDFRVGLDVVLGNRGLAMLYGLIALVVLTIMPTFTLTPLLVRQQFNGGVNHIALMEGLSGVGIIGGGILISMISLTALAPPHMFWLATVWWFVSGVSFSTGNAPMMTLIQTSVPNAMQGRVISLLNTVFGLAGPVGLALSSILGTFVSVQGIFIIGGTLSALVCVLGLLVPDLMRLEHTMRTKVQPPMKAPLEAAD